MTRATIAVTALRTLADYERSLVQWLGEEAQGQQAEILRTGLLWLDRHCPREDGLPHSVSGLDGAEQTTVSSDWCYLLLCAAAQALVGETDARHAGFAAALEGGLEARRLEASLEQRMQRRKRKRTLQRMAQAQRFGLAGEAQAATCAEGGAADAAEGD